MVLRVALTASAQLLASPVRRGVVARRCARVLPLQDHGRRAGLVVDRRKVGLVAVAAEGRKVDGSVQLVDGGLDGAAEELLQLGGREVAVAAAVGVGTWATEAP